MSWKPEVQVRNDPTWYGNGLRFASKDEAYRSARALFFKWTMCEEFRASESEDPVTDYLDEYDKHHSLSQTKETFDTEQSVSQTEENTNVDNG